jgi:serine/threonine protein kinase
MSEQSPSRGTLPPSLVERIDEVCDRFDSAWKAGQRPRIEEYLGDTSQPERSFLLRELLRVELAHRRRGYDTLVPDEYRRRFPDHADLIQAVFDEDAAFSEQSLSTGRNAITRGEVNQPKHLGRYRITGKLGEGAFGVVYKAYDEELRREVAIKVPHRHRVSQPQDVEAYLAEARVLASLDHPHIVPVYDVGRTDDGLCYVVAKFIEGTDLKTKLERASLSVQYAAELVARVAEALYHAHVHGLVHRDIKPANILLDTADNPYVTDFGLAIHLDDFAGPAGTPAYMSPEQIRAESMLDGRSDIFSLGVVLYEALTGHRPFHAEALSELCSQIQHAEPRPLQELRPDVPPELEVVCLRALAKRPVDRYERADRLARDLRHVFELERPVTTIPPSDPPVLAAEDLPAWQLRVTAGSDRGLIRLLTKTRVTLGRSRDCDITLKDKRVSRFHCALVWDRDTNAYTLAQTGSRSPVFVNTRLALEAQAVRLGDKLCVGKTELCLEEVTLEPSKILQNLTSGDFERLLMALADDTLISLARLMRDSVPAAAAAERLQLSSRAVERKQILVLDALARLGGTP